MPVPTPKQQLTADIDRFYDPAMPWVETARTDAVADAFYVRMEYPKMDEEGRAAQRDTAWARVRRADWPEPAYRDALVIDETTWRVAHVTPSGALEWRIKLERNLRINFGA